jgi:hypothetical protein
MEGIHGLPAGHVGEVTVAVAAASAPMRESDPINAAERAINVPAALSPWDTVCAAAPDLSPPVRAEFVPRQARSLLGLNTRTQMSHTGTCTVPPGPIRS